MNSSKHYPEAVQLTDCFSAVGPNRISTKLEFSFSIYLQRGFWTFSARSFFAIFHSPGLKLPHGSWNPSTRESPSQAHIRENYVGLPFMSIERSYSAACQILLIPEVFDKQSKPRFRFES